MIHREGRLQLWYEATSAPGGNDWIGWQIGCAESEDFLQWDRPDVDPCLPFDLNGAEWAEGSFGNSVLWDEEETRCGTGATSGRTATRRPPAIGFAWSEDGLTWTPHPENPILAPEGWERKSVDNPCVVFDGALYHMWYSGRDLAIFPWQVGHATSADGIEWTKDPRPVLSPGGRDGSRDAVYSPTVIFHEDSRTFEAWYTLWDGNRYRIGYATSFDGTTWHKHRERVPVDIRGEELLNVGDGPVTFDGDTYHMYYNVLFGRERYDVRHATSPWTKPRASFVVTPAAMTVVGETVTFDATRSVTPAQAIATYEWNFGDRQTAQGRVVTHVYARSRRAPYRVTLTVTDSAGNSGEIVGLVEASERPVLEFRRGDCNADGKVNISDATCTLDRLFAGATAPGCLAALNTNGDGDVNIADPVFLLNFLFAGGPLLSAPYPDCGPGMLPADELLGCANPPDCQ